MGVEVRLPLGWIALAAAGLAATGGCKARQEEAAKPIPVVIATTVPVHTLLHATLVEVAAAQGLFAREGLAVTIDIRETGPLALAALRDGKADLATCAEVVAVFATFQGHPVDVLASIGSATRSTVLVARQPGIARPSDLAGKRVGLPRGTIAEFFLDTFLVRFGVDRGSVQVVDVRPDEAPDALARGDVDAVAIWEPYPTVMGKRLGETVRLFHAADIHFETHDLVSRPGFARQKPVVVEKFLRALVAAEALLRTRPELARSSVQEHLMRQAPEIGVPEVEAMMALLDFRVRLDHGLLLLMEEEARWAIRSGLVPPQDVPNFLPTLYADPLRAVNPGAVQLMR
jgi:NitT/TauT family transport system substrate-binding protein